MTREAARIAELEARVAVLEACLIEIEARLKLRRKPRPLPPPAAPSRSGHPAGEVLRAPVASA